MKRNIMKIIAILIWGLGIPASFVLSLEFRGGSLYMRPANLVFNYWQFVGFIVLFFALGFIAYQLAIVIEKLGKKTERKKQEEDKNE